MENQTDFAQGQQQGQNGREQQVFEQQAQQGQQGQQQGRGRGALVALAVCCLLVGIGGAGFGVFTMMQKPADRAADLKVKIEKSDGSVVELETDKIKKADDGSTITISDSVTSAEKYIMLGDYGLGLKVPNDSKLQYLQYEYRQFAGGPNYSYLGINGVTKKEGAQALPGFVAQGDDQDLKALAYLEICRNDIDYAVDGVNWICAGDPVYSNDTFSIYYVGPQAVSSQDKDTANWELETVNAIKDWVSNKDNYIAL